MGQTADRNRLRRERIKQLVRKGFSNKELYAQGYGSTVVHQVRKEMGILNPGDLPTHAEVARAKGFGTLKSLCPLRRRRERWEEAWIDGPQEK